VTKAGYWPENGNNLISCLSLPETGSEQELRRQKRCALFSARHLFSFKYPRCQQRNLTIFSARPQANWKYQFDAPCSPDLHTQVLLSINLACTVWKVKRIQVLFQIKEKLIICRKLFESAFQRLSTVIVETATGTLGLINKKDKTINGLQMLKNSYNSCQSISWKRPQCCTGGIGKFQ